MAGQKLVDRISTIEDGIKDSKTGAIMIGLSFTEIIENGNVEPDDEWGLFRLTDDGLSFYREGAEFAAGIMSMRIGGQRAVEEITRFKTQEEAIQAKNELSSEEKGRTLLGSVRPK